MVFNLSISSSDDGETPALTPVASPRACSGCVGVIRRFDRPGLQDRSRDGGAVGQMQEENPLGSNDSAGKVYGKKLVVVLVELHDERQKRKAMRLVSGLPGIAYVTMDTNYKKLTVSGDVDPVEVVSKLKKLWYTEILSVEAAKEDDGKKDEGEKEEGKKDDQVANLVKAHQTYYKVPHQEAANCVIC